MNTVERIKDLQFALKAARRTGKSIGFVPTMGALHAGHVSLLERARADNDLVVMSLFVNPTQFNDPEDFEKYPRDPVQDQKVAAAAGVDMIFQPSMDLIYPPDFDTVVVARRLSDILEGESRPGHFQGVATVVVKFLNIVGPDRAYFGVKDYQQLAVIRRVVTDLNSPVDVIPCATLREPDGLAMSSRNVRLTPAQRSAATILKRALNYAQEIADTGVHDAYALRAWLSQTIAVETEAKLDYATIVDPDDLKEVDTIDSGGIALVAAVFGNVRLIDNQVLTPAPGYEVRR